MQTEQELASGYSPDSGPGLTPDEARDGALLAILQEQRKTNEYLAEIQQAFLTIAQAMDAFSSSPVARMIAGGK